jgi:hypothetical protein
MTFLLKQLLHWFMFGATAFFAAGAVIDAGAGDGGAIDDIGSGGDSGADDGGADGDGSAGSGDPAGDDPGADENGRSASDRGDGRTLPKNIQGALKTFKEAHPELAKEIDELRKGYFGNRQHGEFFKSPGEARQAKAALDLVGGASGIADLQSKVAAIDMVDGALEAGDPQVLDDMFSDFGEGMKKLAGPFLDRLEKLDPKTAFAITQPYPYKLLESAELGQRLNEAFAAIGANKPEDAKTILTNIYRWLEGQKAQAGNRGGAEDPERVKLTQDQQKFAADKERAFRQDIGRQTVAHQSSEVRRVLNADPRFRKLGKDAQADLFEGANAEINRRLKGDATYQNQMKTNLASRGRKAEQIVSYVNATVSEIVSKAVPAVMTRRYGSAPVATRANANANAGAEKNQQRTNPANAGPIKLQGKPKREDVDWAKTKDVLYITNKAYMKNGPHKGKLVTW